MTEYRFQETNFNKDGTIGVCPAQYYTPKSGFGFFTERSLQSAKECRLPELHTGFVPSSWFQGETVIVQDAHGCYVKSPFPENRRMPLSFQADTRTQGSFLLTLTLYAGEEEKEVLVFAGRRQLIWRGSLQAGEEWNGSFPLFLCDIIPRGEEVPFKNQSAEVTVISRSTRISKLQIETWHGKTLFLAGDSTVTDQSAEYPYAPETSYSGWGQMLPAYLGKAMAVSNHAHSGLTTESFRDEGHYQILMDSIKPEDICLFQFGHNDQKQKHLKAEEGYRENLIRYIREIREKEAQPVLVTPLARNSWKGTDGTYHDLLKEYADEIIRLGKRMKVPVLDLHEKSMAFMKEHGLEDSKRWFYPSDYTHTNDFGSWNMAGFIWEELIKTGMMKADRDKKPVWEPPKDIKLWVPENLTAFKDTAKEESFILERAEDNLTRAEALDFVIEAIHYFPTNVYNDSFSDVIGHEWFAGTVECAVQNGLIPNEMVEDGRFYPNCPITLEEFLWIAMTGYKSRKDLSESKLAQIKGTVPMDNKKRNMTRREAAAILSRLEI